jgi:di/tricarboxylate transporter
LIAEADLDMEALLGGAQPYIALVLLVLLLAAFVIERYPPEVTAAGGAAAFLLLGLTTPEDAMRVFSNSAPITIAAMFVLSGALVRTGVLENLASRLTTSATNHPALVVAALLVGTVAASAFMNNTPVVLILIPIVFSARPHAGHRSHEAADPDFLRGDPRRHLHADRHVYQHSRRRCGAQCRRAGVLDLRDNPDRHRGRTYRNIGHVAPRAFPAA